MKRVAPADSANLRREKETIAIICEIYGQNSNGIVIQSTFMKRIFLLLFLFILAGDVVSQQTLSMKEYLQVVKTYHPLTKAAALDVEIASAGIRSARGAFDPIFQNEISRKEFGGLLYYNLQTTEIKIPTWFGLTISGGIQTLNGNRTDPTDTKGNTSFLGVSFPVAKGLLMDERRAALQTAKIYQSLSVEQQRNAVNDLMFEAAKAYWSWWQQYLAQRIIEVAARNAEQRFYLIKKACLLGDRPAIDTIEALAQWQNFRLQQNETELSVRNTLLALSVYLWTADGTPYVLPGGIEPVEEKTAAPFIDTASLAAQLPLHPYIRQYQYKKEALEVQRKAKFQSLLPAVYLKYNQLNKTQEVWKNISSPWFDNNYRYGISVALPLRLSEGRGEYRKAKLKITQTLLERDNVMASQQVKLRQYGNEYSQLRQQIALQKEVLSAYAALQHGEEVRWRNGESSLFVINTREQRKLESELKLTELRAKQGKALAAMFWTAGVLEGNDNQTPDVK